MLRIVETLSMTMLVCNALRADDWSNSHRFGRGTREAVESRITTRGTYNELVGSAGKTGSPSALPGSVEHRVHNLLSSRLEAIRTRVGRIPDLLSDVWIQLAEHDEAKARELIDRASPKQSPFDLRYSMVAAAQWESYTNVLNAVSTGALLRKGWD